MQEHGSFELEIIKQTLVVKVFDAWNFETARRCSVEYKQLVETINNKPWACLVDVRYWQLGTPEAMDEINQLNVWGNNHNQKYEAVVCDLSIQQWLLEITHQSFTVVETKFCDDIPAAYEWLKSIKMI